MYTIFHHTHVVAHDEIDAVIGHVNNLSYLKWMQAAALAQAKATLPPLRKALAQQRDLLAALSGAYAGEGPPETFRLVNLHLPVELPVSLPSQLVEQRPDVRAAEEQLHAASALVGVATANLLPNFTISATGGYTNTVFAALISPQSLAWELAGNATQTIFDAGTLLHQLEGARDTYQAAAWTYRAGSARKGRCRLPTPAVSSTRRRWACSTPTSAVWSTATSSRPT